MKIMAIDFGDSRTGLAVCDKLELLAVPIGVIKESDFENVVEKIVNEIIEKKIDKVIVGYPKNMNGSIGERAKKSECLVAKLQERVQNIPVVLWDERCTTKSATDFLNITNTRGQKRKNVIDAVAATIILESYLNYIKNEKEKK